MPSPALRYVGPLPGPARRIDPETRLPFYTGRPALVALRSRYGLPNAYGEGLPFAATLSMFVDDDLNGKPVALWAEA